MKFEYAFKYRYSMTSFRRVNVTLNETVTGTSLCILEDENSCRIVVSYNLNGEVKKLTKPLLNETQQI